MPVILSLSGFFVASLAVTIVTQVLYLHSYHIYFLYEFLPGCYWGNTKNTSIQWHAWIPSLALECTLMLLTIYKVFSYRDGMNRTIALLARDSIVYFVIIVVGLSLLIANGIHPFISKLGIPVQPSIECIAFISTGRMMMNIRGLIMDDPAYTVHLQTLEFANCHSSGSETKARVEEISVDSAVTDGNV